MTFIVYVLFPGPGMEGDIAPKEEDPIVREIDVYLSTDLKDSL